MELALLLKPTEFDSETTHLLTMEFDDVWDIIQAAGGPFVADNRAAVTRTPVWTRIATTPLPPS